jgi:hypothetical protein
VDDLNDRDKAAALEDFARAFCEEYWDVDQSSTWIVIDGSAEVSSETVRVLRLVFHAARAQVDPEWAAIQEQARG